MPNTRLKLCVSPSSIDSTDNLIFVYSSFSYTARVFMRLRNLWTPHYSSGATSNRDPFASLGSRVTSGASGPRPPSRWSWGYARWGYARHAPCRVDGAKTETVTCFE